MSGPKIAACPKCSAPGDDLSVYRYENGWQHVECDSCHYMGPGEGSKVQAIKSHNVRANVTAAGDA